MPLGGYGRQYTTNRELVRLDALVQQGLGTMQIARLMKRSDSWVRNYKRYLGLEWINPVRQAEAEERLRRTMAALKP